MVYILLPNFQKLWIGLEAMNSIAKVQFDSDGEVTTQEIDHYGNSVEEFAYNVRILVLGLCNVWSAKMKCRMHMDLACRYFFIK